MLGGKWTKGNGHVAAQVHLASRDRRRDRIGIGCVGGTSHPTAAGDFEVERNCIESQI